MYLSRLSQIDRLKISLGKEVQAYQAQRFCYKERKQQKQNPQCIQNILRNDVSCSSSATAAFVNTQGDSKPFMVTVLARIRAIAFYAWTLVLSIPLFMVMLLAYPYVLIFDRFRRQVEHSVNSLWARLTTALFYKIEVSGLENLPPADQGAVYVANHESFVDIFTLFQLDRDFKFVSKVGIFLIPIIGWSMFLTGHIMLNRTDSKSQQKMLDQSRTLLRNKASVLVFPEGTRSKSGRMGQFKKGAFTIAHRAQAPIVPITLDGAGALMPNQHENLLYPGKVRVVIHPTIPAGSAPPTEVLKRARKAIASELHVSKIMPKHTVDKTQLEFLSDKHFQERPELMQYVDGQ